MAYSWWDALKDVLGAASPILIAVPWLRDFWLRRRRLKVEQVEATGRLSQLKVSIEGAIKEKIDSPKAADFVWTILGLVLIFISFLIAFIRGLADLFEAST
ncbi:hypothetical protein AYJ54_24615 [Bradyrhizobium centrolobii]|uniref:Uncharacterized protein n=2 Tax=Bradyrhizobium TaxID=374 RepID=A0A176ZGQ7_9BRAD|nr:MULTISPECIES: hypothetical protein [Bradyrhizobium]OAF04039.1 hypothetical protein AYJ54_24615 [Bradyrhizobium centrolobii]OAF19667.1 hypothetical protein AXW67_36295 [Bradyrhizobium neotropicale]